MNQSSKEQRLRLLARVLFLSLVMALLHQVAFVGTTAVAAEGDADTSETSTEAPTTPSPQSSATPEDGAAESESDDAEEEEEAEYVPPWDFSPYKVLVWIVSDDPSINAQTLARPLTDYLDRDFSSVWRLSIANAPSPVVAAAWRDLRSINYDQLVASDPIIAVKRDHPDAVRIRFASNLQEFVKRVYGTQGLIAEVLRRGEENGNPTIDGASEQFEVVDSDLLGVQERWTDASTEALLLPRGLALAFEKPSAKILNLPITDLVSSAIDAFDKIYIVRIDSTASDRRVWVVECETLMRLFGAPVSESFSTQVDLPGVIGHSITEAFSPVVRIDDAGQSSARGLVRASGLVTDPESPALVNLGDILQPVIRKNDRNGKPIMIGRIDWAYLFAVADPVAVDDWVKLSDKGETKGRVLNNDTDIDPGDSLEVGKVIGQRAYAGRTYEIKPDPEAEPIATVVFTDLEKGQFTLTPGEGFPGSVSFDYSAADKYGNLDDATVTVSNEKPEIEIPPAREIIPRSVKMMYYSGRAGGLQGRRNNRTFRRALKIRPQGEGTLLRLHAKGDPNAPLIGYEIYQKELTSTKMTFIGRTDWNGRFYVQKNDDPMRLMYIKNGGAVLARLPMVPGLTDREVADLTGDDMRLQAEAYIRGVQNAIVDLVAIRRLLAARVKLRLQRGQFKEAEELVNAMREQPTSETLSNDMGAQLPMFLKAIGTRDANQRRKVDNMFTQTREMLAKQLSPRDIRDVEAMLLAAKANGGTLPPDEVDPDAVDSSVNEVKSEQ